MIFILDSGLLNVHVRVRQHIDPPRANVVDAVGIQFLANACMETLPSASAPSVYTSEIADGW